MRSGIIALLALQAFFINSARSEERKPDFQLRVPLHLQSFGEKVGYAAWLIFPDITAQNSQNTFVALGGLLYNFEDKGWLEILGGARFNENNYRDPLLNIRFLHKNLRPFISFTDIGYFPRESKRRLYWATSLSLPITTKPVGIQVGIETENIHLFDQPDSWGIGPRTTISWRKVSGTFAYQARTDQDFVRIYLSTNLKLE